MDKNNKEMYEQALKENDTKQKQTTESEMERLKQEQLKRWQQQEQQKQQEQQEQQRQQEQLRQEIQRPMELSTYLVEVGTEGVNQKIIIKANHIMEALAKFNQIYWNSFFDLDILGVSIEEIECVE